MDKKTFAISGIDQYAIGTYLVDQNLKLSQLKQLQKDFYPVLKAKGSLPFGEKGRLEYENVKVCALPVIDAAKNIALKNQLPDISGQININSMTITDNLTKITEHGLHFFTYGRLNGSRLIAAWIRHLFLNLTAPDHYPKNTIVTGRDPQGKKNLVQYQFLPLKSDGLQYFKKLVQIYLQGRDQVFYFSCETSWQLVQILSKNSFNPDPDIVLKAMNNSKVTSIWYGNNYYAGEKSNPYISLCLKNKDPFESVETLLDSGFVQNSISVYKPLLENLKTINK